MEGNTNGYEQGEELESCRDPGIRGCPKLSTYDWMEGIPMASSFSGVVEIRFKNTRKGFYNNINNLSISAGDIVAVEGSPGHDIGIVSLTGELVRCQMSKNGMNGSPDELRKIYRKAKPADIDKWKEAIAREDETMLRTRKIAEGLGLDMKVTDVEFQGDGNKAIFYYIADERVDFRELIRVLADEFRIRVEMKQIGARQEAGRIGGIGSCGRELCCASWISSFVSVTTNAARLQEVSLNPQKLAGQCGKLKCCLNFEVDGYIDAQKDFPDKHVVLELENGRAYYQKTDVYRRVMWYSCEKESSTNLVAVPVERVREIMEQNRKGMKSALLADNGRGSRIQANGPGPMVQGDGKWNSKPGESRNQKGRGRSKGKHRRRGR